MSTNNDEIDLTKTSWDKSKDKFKDSFSSDNLGASIGLLTGGLGSMINSSLNNAKIGDTATLENLITATNSYQSDATSLDTLYDEWNTRDMLENTNWKDIRGSTTGDKVGNLLSSTASGATTGLAVGGPWGALIGAVVGAGSGLAGWLTGDKKAKKKADLLNRQIQNANEQKIATLQNSLASITQQNYLKDLAAFSKYGGFLGKKQSTKIPTNLNRLTQQNTDINKKFNTNIFADGGNLNINSNINNEVLDTGIKQINTGGTHEQNPLGGVAMGMADNDIPNLVESGEVVYNNYVYSDRLYLTKTLLEKFKIPNKYEGMTFASVARKLNKDIHERPNDPITQNTIEDNLFRLMRAQEILKKNKIKRDLIKQLKKDEDNISTTQNIINSTNSIPSLEQMQTMMNMGSSNNMTENTVDESIASQSAETGMSQEEENLEQDKITSNENLINNSEQNIMSGVGENLLDRMLSSIGDSATNNTNVESTEQSEKNKKANSEKTKKEKATTNKHDVGGWLQYAPLAASGLGVIDSIINSIKGPDYSALKPLDDILKSEQAPIEIKPVTEKMQYKPTDPNYLTNMIMSSSANTRRAIENNSYGNPGEIIQNLLTTDYLTNNAIGKTLLEAQKENRQHLSNVKKFNAGIEQFNSQLAFEAAKANSQRNIQKASIAADRARNQIILDDALAKTMSTNWNTFITNLSLLGKNIQDKNIFDMYVENGHFGNLTEQQLKQIMSSQNYKKHLKNKFITLDNNGNMSLTNDQQFELLDRKSQLYIQQILNKKNEKNIIYNIDPIETNNSINPLYHQDLA